MKNENKLEILKFLGVFGIFVLCWETISLFLWKPKKQ